MLRGEVGEVVVRVPWRSLGREPLVVELHDVTLLLAPIDSAAYDPRAEAERGAPAKHEALAAWEVWVEFFLLWPRAHSHPHIYTHTARTRTDAPPHPRRSRRGARRRRRRPSR